MKNFICSVFICSIVLFIGCDTTHEKPKLNIVNTTGYGIQSVYVTPSVSDTWGNDILTATIPNGGSVVMKFSKGTYDFLAVDDTSPFYCYEQFDNPLKEDKTFTWELNVADKMIACPTWVTSK